MRSHFAFVCAAVCVFAAGVYSQTSNKRSGDETVVPGRYIVILNEKFVDPLGLKNDTAFLINDLSSTYGATIDKTFTHAIKGFAAEMSANSAEALSMDQRVKWVEPDRLMSVSTSQNNAPWNLDRVDQRNLPRNDRYDYNSMGTGVHVYVLDTGIRVTHSEFGGRASVAFDDVGDGQNGADCNGHGTHVAGIVGSATWGVAKNAYLHSVRVIGCSGTGLLSNLLGGVDWITFNHASPAVANISATVPGASVSLETAITNSIASGVVYTIAAGNAAADACTYTPARTPNALTVGASDQSDLRALYSNWGSCLDVFAPGHQIVSTWASGDTATASLSGSSMAAPMVAGAAALYLEANPTASAGSVAQGLKTLATSGVLTTNDPSSPNLLLYSQIGLAPTNAAVTVSGRVTMNNRGIRKIWLSLTDLSNGTTVYALTNFLGTYQFGEVQTGRTYLLTATSTRRYTITPQNRTLSVNDDVSGVDFVAQYTTY